MGAETVPMRSPLLVRLLRAAQSWRKAELNRHVIAAILSVGLATAFLKLVTAGREVAVAYRFGTGDALDAFIVAFLPASFVIGVQVAAFSAALMPTFIRIRDREGPLAARRLAENALLVTCPLLIGMSLLLLVLGGPIIRLVAGGFTPEKQALTLHLYQLLLPVILLQGLIKFYGTLLNAGRRFWVAASAPAATPLLTILLLALGWADVGWLVAGVIGGAAIELVLVVLLAWRMGLLVLPRWHGFDPATRTIVRQYVPVMLGALAGSTAPIVNQGMAAMLDPGSVAALSYGLKLITLVLAFVAQPLSTAVLPFFAELAAAGAYEQLRRAFRTWLGLVVVLSTPLAVALCLLSAPIVQLIFERGAFTAADTSLVARIQALYALQIPFYLAGVLGSRVLNAMGLNQVTGLIGVMNCATNIVFSYLLMQWLGLPGIALSTTLVYLCSCIAILLVVHGRLERPYRAAVVPAGAV